MTLEQVLLIAILIVPLALALLNRLRMDVAALIIAAALGVCQALGLGMLGPAQSPALAARAITGFGQPAVITLLAITGLSHRQAYGGIFAITLIKSLAVLFVIAVFYLTGIV